jgi:hypothetical protein
MTARTTEMAPASQETILVNRVGIRENVTLDQYIGGLEGIDEGPHRLSLGTAIQSQECRTEEAQRKY